jgi:hypothetical protein
MLELKITFVNFKKVPAHICCQVFDILSLVEGFVQNLVFLLTCQFLRQILLMPDKLCNFRYEFTYFCHKALNYVLGMLTYLL